MEHSAGVRPAAQQAALAVPLALSWREEPRQLAQAQLPSGARVAHSAADWPPIAPNVEHYADQKEGRAELRS